MLNKIKNRKQEGFTIIEVLIVLAIAGLIMLIVFLAVPALQRNSRNTQRQADVSKIAAAVSSCMSARNGDLTKCNTVPLLTANGGFEIAKLQQITTINISSAMPATSEIANLNFARKCLDDSSDGQPGLPRQAAIVYRNENSTTGITKCLDV